MTKMTKQLRMRILKDVETFLQEGGLLAKGSTWGTEDTNYGQCVRGALFYVNSNGSLNNVDSALCNVYDISYKAINALEAGFEGWNFEVYCGRDFLPVEKQFYNLGKFIAKTYM